MDMMTTIASQLASTIASVWPDVEGLPVADEIRGLLAVPPDPALGDYAFPCFRLAKPLRSAPPKIAEALCAAWKDEDTASVQPVNGYMNFFLNRANFAAGIMAELQEKKDRFGSGEEGKGKTILFNLLGHGLIDMTAYDQYLSGDLTNFTLPQEEIDKTTSKLEHII